MNIKRAEDVGFWIGVGVFALVGAVVYVVYRFLLQRLGDEWATLIVYVPAFFAVFLIKPVQDRYMAIARRRATRKNEQPLPNKMDPVELVETRADKRHDRAAEPGQQIADNLNRNVMAREASNAAISEAKAAGKSQEEALRLGQLAYDSVRATWKPTRGTAT